MTNLATENAQVSIVNSRLDRRVVNSPSWRVLNAQAEAVCNAMVGPTGCSQRGCAPVRFYCNTCAIISEMKYATPPKKGVAQIAKSWYSLASKQKEHL